MIGCLRTCVCKQPIVTLYYEIEIVLNFYNLKACSCVELIGHDRIAFSILEPPKFRFSEAGLKGSTLFSRLKREGLKDVTDNEKILFVIFSIRRNAFEIQQ